MSTTGRAGANDGAILRRLIDAISINPYMSLEELAKAAGCELSTLTKKRYLISDAYNYIAEHSGIINSETLYNMATMVLFDNLRDPDIRVRTHAAETIAKYMKPENTAIDLSEYIGNISIGANTVPAITAGEGDNYEEE